MICPTHSFKMIRLILISTLLLFANSPSEARRVKISELTKVDPSRIVGGQQTTIQTRPYQAALLLTDGTSESLCGGSILSSKWVLTAAHCLTGITRIQVRVGSDRFDSGGDVYVTTSYRIHPLYDIRPLDCDIGLVQIQGSTGIRLNDSTVKAITLASAGNVLPTGTPVTVSGWGTTSENGVVSDVLMEVAVEIYDTQTCSTAYNIFTNRMLCAGVQGGGKDACQGDSGGPLVTNDLVQVGIVSFGTGCARDGFPGVYTNVASLRRWIQTYTRF